VYLLVVDWSHWNLPTMPKVKIDIELAPFLNVPFEDKAKAKMLGARWNADAHRWFIPRGVDPAPFAPWIAELDNTPSLRAACPFYVLESTETCWKCGKEAQAVTVASEGCRALPAGPADLPPDDDADDEPIGQLDRFVLYSYVEHLPARLAAFMRQHYPLYFVDHSKTTDTFYWINHCPCGAPFGDFHLHSEPGGAFFPIDKARARTMTLLQLKASGHVALRASMGSGPDDLIPRAAKRAFLPL